MGLPRRGLLAHAKHGKQPGAEIPSETRSKPREQPPMIDAPPSSLNGSSTTRAPARSLWQRARAFALAIQLRLRIPLILVISALVVGRWDVIRNYGERLTRGASGAN